MCAFPTNKQGLANSWDTDIQPIIDVLTGVSGGGDQVQLIQYSNASNYALDVRNLDTTNAYGLRVRDAASNNLLLVYKNAITLGASAANDVLTINCNISGKVYIGDSANGDMTVGLTIQQAGNDDQALCVKSTDVAHSMTTLAETDTYGVLMKAQDTSGGLGIIGYKDADGDAGYAIYIAGRLGEAADTTKSTSGIGVCDIQANVITGTTVTTVGADGNLLTVRNNTTTRFIFDAEGTLHSIGATATDSIGNGLWFLGDTANADMTLGLTINQGTNTNQAFALKNGVVAHGMTDIVETDTYGEMKMQHPTAGGLYIRGLKDADGESSGALTLIGVLGEAADTTKSTVGFGVIRIGTNIKSGTTIAAVGADGNLLSIENSGTTRFLFDAEGSAHSDVEWTTFDAHDDVALLNRLDAALTRDPIKTEFGRFLGDYRQELQAAKVVNFYDDGPRAMLNTTRLSMLLTGAVRQLGRRLELAEARLAALPAGG